MSKKKVQTNGNREGAAEQVERARGTVVAGAGTVPATGTAGQIESGGPADDATTDGSARMAADVDDTGNGSVSDAGQKPSGSAPGEDGTDAESARSADTGQQPARERVADTDAQSGDGDGSARAAGAESAGGGDAKGVGEGDSNSTATVDGSAADHSGVGGEPDGKDVPDGTGGLSGDATATNAIDSGASLEGTVDSSGGAAGISGDLKAAFELAGCETAEQLIDMAVVGSSLMERIANIIKQEGEFKDWSPMNDPAELVYDLFNALEYAKEQAANAEQPKVPNWAPDADPQHIAFSFACDVFYGVHGSVDIAGVVINGLKPLERLTLPFEAMLDIAELVRKIGSRATPEVLAQQLVIGKHRQSAALTKAEEIALKAFASVLIDLDEYAASERARIEAEAAEKPKPRAVPIDETNGELTDGPMDTWR